MLCRLKPTPAVVSTIAPGAVMFYPGMAAEAVTGARLLALGLRDCGPDLRRVLLMALLAVTSFNRAIKAMGAARWQMLHRAIYAIALLGLLHFFWMRAAKNDFAEVAVYAVVIAVLLGWRMKRALAKRGAGTAI